MSEKSAYIPFTSSDILREDSLPLASAVGISSIDLGVSFCTKYGAGFMTGAVGFSAVSFVVDLEVGGISSKEENGLSRVNGMFSVIPPSPLLSPIFPSSAKY